MTSVDHIQQSFVFIFILNVIITLLGRDRPLGSSERIPHHELEKNLMT